MAGDIRRPGVLDGFPTIRTVELGAPARWLRAGVADLRRSGWASLFYGVCFAAAGWLSYGVFVGAYELFAGLVTGFLLLGPLLAMGLYDLSRRIEAGETPRLAPTLAAWRPNIGNVAVLSAVFAVVMLVWARASMVIFALSFDSAGLPTVGDVVRAVVTFAQPEFAVTYLVVGGFFAVFIFAVGVVSVPLMLDRGTDAVTAAIVSLSVCARNPGPMAVWAACIVALVGIGMAPGFLGLIWVMPVVGHATWHAYRELVEARPRGTGED